MTGRNKEQCEVLCVDTHGLSVCLKSRRLFAVTVTEEEEEEGDGGGSEEGPDGD